MALIYNATFDKNTRKLSFEDKAGNEIYSFTVPDRGPAVDDITKPLTFKATEDGSTVQLTKRGSPVGDFQFSFDGGKNWVDYTIDDVIRLNIGDEVSFRAKSSRLSNQSDVKYFQFNMTGKIEAWHNVMSLYRTINFSTYNTAVSYAFYMLFYGCTSLTKAPALPATTLTLGCYAYMFFRCSLTKAPELPATTLTNTCYSSMFSGCQSLKEVRIAATKTASYALEEWLFNVSSTGDFYCDPNATIFPTDSASGIPENWRRLNINEGPAVDDITKPLTFRATQDGSTVKLSKANSPSGDFQTSRDGGNTWTDYTIGTAITLNTSDEVSFRAKSDRTSEQDEGNYFYFEMTGKIEAWHNVMSMYRTSAFATYDTAMSYAFTDLFRDCTSLTKAPVLPATTLSRGCYQSMFSGCQSLAEAPELPATQLDFYCYSYMFSGCQSLKEVRISATAAKPFALQLWIEGVSATGDFYCDPNATIFPTGTSGIPENWTRHNIADYPN